MLFVDLVGSTQLVASADPEVVRTRLARFFEQIAHCITAHGGIVQKFAGDAVMAAFGVPVAHEDDPERAVRAALAIVDAVEEPRPRGPDRVESGEIVSDEERDDVRDGPGDQRGGAAAAGCRAGRDPARAGRRAADPRHASSRRRSARSGAGFPGRGRGVEVVSRRRGGRSRLTVSVPFIGREEELELLHNTFARAGTGPARRTSSRSTGPPGSASRDSRASSSTASSARRFSSGRCLPYGEGVTYWAIAEMVKVAAGITDDDSVDAAPRSSAYCCGDDAVADLLALASGVLDAVGGERSAAGDRVGARRPGRRSSPTCSRSCSSSRTSTGRRSRCST